MPRHFLSEFYTRQHSVTYVGRFIVFVTTYHIICNQCIHVWNAVLQIYSLSTIIKGSRLQRASVSGLVSGTQQRILTASYINSVVLVSRISDLSDLDISPLTW